MIVAQEMGEGICKKNYLRIVQLPEIEAHSI